MSKRHVITIAVVLLLSSAALHAQQSAEELSQAAANPLADLMSFPFQYNSNFGLGPFDRSNGVLNIQPVIPLAGGKFITRTILPFVWIPDVASESGTVASGLSDLTFTGFYTPSAGSVTWGAGPVLEIPSGGVNRGSQKWSLGPSFVVLAQPGPWTLGLLGNNVWSFAGDSGRDSVNKGLIQYFVVRQLGNGWYVNGAPIITVNWKADDGQKWVVPIGGGGGKILMAGRLPVNAQVNAYYNVVKPDVGPDWQCRVQVQFLLPTSIFRGGNP